jgi:hypothetical protein
MTPAQPNAQAEKEQIVLKTVPTPIGVCHKIGTAAEVEKDHGVFACVYSDYGDQKSDNFAAHIVAAVNFGAGLCTDWLQTHTAKQCFEPEALRLISQQEEELTVLRAELNNTHIVNEALKSASNELVFEIANLRAELKEARESIKKSNAGFEEYERRYYLETHKTERLQSELTADQEALRGQNGYEIRRERDELRVKLTAAQAEIVELKKQIEKHV